MATRVANLGYMAIRKETSKGVPAGIPNVFVPFHSEKLSVLDEKVTDNPIIGNNYAKQEIVKGFKSFTGDLQIKADPNIAGYFFDMLMVKTGTTGSGPYAHTFKFMNGINAVNPNSYTMDISHGNVVERFAGVEAHSIANEFDGPKMLLNVGVSALEAFQVAEIASVVGADVTLKTNNYPIPTALLQASDLVRILDVSTGVYTDYTISSKSDPVLTLNSSPSGIGDGDLIFLRPQAPSLALLTTMTWPRTEYRFGTDLTAALSASQRRIDEGTWNLMYNFEANEGVRRSGSYSIAELVRTIADIEASIRIPFDSPEELIKFINNTKQGVSIKHFSQASDSYGIDIGLYDVKYNAVPTEMESESPIYSEVDLMPEFSETDGHAVTVTVNNNIATI